MDLEKEISKALSDPDIMSKVSGVLSSLSSGTQQESGENKEVAGISDNKEKGISDLLGNLGGAVQDDRTRLLIAIKPFLSEKRAPYMDSAITILKLASLGKLGKDFKLF